MSSTSSKLLVGYLRKVRKVEAQPVRMHRRTRLLYMRAQHLAQRRVQQVRAGVVAPDGIAPLPVNNRVDVIAHRKVLLENGFVCAHALNREHAADDFGNGRVAVSRSKRSHVADLPA